MAQPRFNLMAVSEAIVQKLDGTRLFCGNCCAKQYFILKFHLVNHILKYSKLIVNICKLPLNMFLSPDSTFRLLVLAAILDLRRVKRT